MPLHPLKRALHRNRKDIGLIPIERPIYNNSNFNFFFSQCSHLSLTLVYTFYCLIEGCPNKTKACLAFLVDMLYHVVNKGQASKQKEQTCAAFDHCLN